MFRKPFFPSNFPLRGSYHPALSYLFVKPQYKSYNADDSISKALYKQIETPNSYLTTNKVLPFVKESNKRMFKILCQNSVC